MEHDLNHLLKTRVREDMEKRGSIPPEKQLIEVLKLIRTSDQVFPQQDGGISFVEEPDDEDVDERRVTIHPDWTMEFRVFVEGDIRYTLPQKMPKEFIFSCPYCGIPSADVKALCVDIHSGAMYECDACGGDVVFEVKKAQQ